MQIIATAITKGGAGKSTTAAALAQAAAYSGKKVLCIDLDPQANLTAFIGADPNQAGAYHLLTGTDPAQVVQRTAQKIDIIPANSALATLTTHRGSANRLREAIAPLKKRYNYIFIDTPSQAGELVYNALQAATGLIIPLETDDSSIQGLYQTTDIAHQIRHSNPELSIIGVLITRYDARAKINRHLKTVIESTGQELGAPLLGEIRAGVAIREAHGFRESLFDYAPRSKPAADYMRIYESIAKPKRTRKHK